MSSVFRQIETIEHGDRESRALLCVIGVLHLADVVQDQREGEELRRSDLSEDRAEPLSRRAGRVPKPLEATYRQQRVLVDGVPVVEIADDAAMNSAELRQNPIEQPAIVHLGEAHVQPRARVEEVSQLVALGFGTSEVFRPIPVDVLLDAIERLLRDGAAVREREPENLEPERRFRGCGVDVEEPYSVVGDLELPADQPLHGGSCRRFHGAL